jgi:hypothetical protein
MRNPKIIIPVILAGILFYFIIRPGDAKLRDDLNSKNHATVIVKAAYKLGERKDNLAIKALLSNILDPRMSTNIKFKGMTVCYCKLVALKKITNLSPPIKLDQFSVDTVAAKFYLDWAIENKIIRQNEKIDLTYYHQ